MNKLDDQECREQNGKIECAAMKVKRKIKYRGVKE